MSRVTKLQKLNRRAYNAKKDRQSRGWAKSRRIRRAQGAKLYDWEPGYRRPPRGSWNVRGCRCGHKLHGKYGCTRGCAWGECSAINVPRQPIEFVPLVLGDRDHEFEYLSAMNAAMVCSAFGLPSGRRVLLVGDSHIADLVAKELDKRL